MADLKAIPAVTANAAFEISAAPDYDAYIAKTCGPGRPTRAARYTFDTEYHARKFANGRPIEIAKGSYIAVPRGAVRWRDGRSVCVLAGVTRTWEVA